MWWTLAQQKYPKARNVIQVDTNRRLYLPPRQTSYANDYPVVIKCSSFTGKFPVTLKKVRHIAKVTSCSHKPRAEGQSIAKDDRPLPVNLTSAAITSTGTRAAPLGITSKGHRIQPMSLLGQEKFRGIISCALSTNRRWRKSLTDGYHC